MKKLLTITIIYFCISYSYFLQSSYPPITNKALCQELNVIRRSLASNNTPNKTIIENLRNFIKKYGNQALSLANTRGNTLLSEASFRRRYKVVKFLLEHNADPNSIDQHESTALHRACRKINDYKYLSHAFQIIKLLIPKTDLLTRKNIYEKTPADLINEHNMFSKEQKSELLKLITLTQNKKNLDHSLSDKDEKSIPFLQELYQYGAFESITFSLNCTDNLNTITIAAYYISVNNILTYKEKETLLQLAYSKIYPNQEKIFFEEPLTNGQKICLRVTHGIVF